MSQDCEGFVYPKDKTNSFCNCVECIIKNHGNSNYLTWLVDAGGPTLRETYHRRLKEEGLPDLYGQLIGKMKSTQPSTPNYNDAQIDDGWISPEGNEYMTSPNLVD